jgi:hypothetical protein
VAKRKRRFDELSHYSILSDKQEVQLERVHVIKSVIFSREKIVVLYKNA